MKLIKTNGNLTTTFPKFKTHRTKTLTQVYR